MVSVTLAIPDDIKRKMEHFSEINWSGFIRNKIIEKTKELSFKEEMLAQWNKEKPIVDWAVKLQKESRKNRFKELQKKGLI